MSNRATVLSNNTTASLYSFLDQNCLQSPADLVGTLQKYPPDMSLVSRNTRFMTLETEKQRKVDN